MRKIIYLIVFIAFICVERASAQKDTAIMYMKTITSANAPSTEIVVDSKDSADFIRFVMPPNSAVDKRLYPVADYYFNGKPKLIGSSTNATAFINLQGNCIEFYPNGHKKVICNYDKGVAVGNMFQFFSNGKIYISGSFADSKFILITCNDSTGKILAENGSGTWVKYDGGLKKVIEEGPVINGKEDGEWKGRFNDTVSYSCIYKDGDFVSGISYDNKGNQYPFKDIEVAPEFKGGLDAFMQFITRNFRYTESARRNNVSGRMIVAFVIDKEGSLKNIHVIRSIDSGLEEEAVRVLKACPPWKPGYQYGIPVQVKYTIPIALSLY
jgi:TonB family protein